MPNRIESVFDASVVLAFIKGETGAAEVAGAVESAGISAINWAEVWAVCYRLGIPESRIRGLEELGLRVLPLTQPVAELAAGIHLNARGLNLSLADCCCLALGLELSLPVYTADSAWTDLELDVEIRLIR